MRDWLEQESMKTRALVASILAVGFLQGCGPLVMIPGGALSGSVKPTPSDWSFSDSIETVQLETRPDDPYSVNVWGIGIGEYFYVAAGDAESGWALNLIEDPRVRLKLADDLYELSATQTNDSAELDAFLAGLKRKYDFEPKPGQRHQATLFRLQAR